MAAVSYSSEKKWVVCDSNFLNYVKSFTRYQLAMSLGREEQDVKKLSDSELIYY